MRLSCHPKSLAKFQTKLKELTRRSNGKGYQWVKDQLNRYIRGWLNYYRLADMQNNVKKLGGWLNRRIRMYIWKSWKTNQNRYSNLVRCGINPWRAWQWANSRKGYWLVAGSGILQRAVNNQRLIVRGYPSLTEMYKSVHPY